MKPFVLRGSKPLPLETGPAGNHSYDGELQIWIDTATGEALVLSGTSGSRFGETTITETREGADSTEVTSLDASRFGETTMTKTFEGTDQVEGCAALASRFGETVVTATVEGADQSEISSVPDAPDHHL